MDRHELFEIFGAVEADGGPFGDQVATACSRVLGVSGSGVALIFEGEHRGSLGASTAAAMRGEDLQHLLGEGPAFDATRSGQLVSEPHLGDHRAGRWPAFAPAATAEGIQAVFAAPLAIGAGMLGALTVYELRAGSLTADQGHDLVSLGGMVSHLVLTVQAGADPGTLATALADAGSYHPEVHQATGMVAARLRVPVSEAMVLLRARAYADGVALEALAREVVSRRIRFEKP